MQQLPHSLRLNPCCFLASEMLHREGAYFIPNDNNGTPRRPEQRCCNPSIAVTAMTAFLAPFASRVFFLSPLNDPRVVF
jgi:hypothetical protein